MNEQELTKTIEHIKEIILKTKKEEEIIKRKLQEKRMASLEKSLKDWRHFLPFKERIIANG